MLSFNRDPKNASPRFIGPRSQSCRPKKRITRVSETLNESTIVPVDEWEGSEEDSHGLCFSKALEIRQDRHRMYMDRISRRIERISTKKSPRKVRGRPASSQHKVNKLKPKVLPEDDFTDFGESFSSGSSINKYNEDDTESDGKEENVVKIFTEKVNNLQNVDYAKENGAKSLRVIKQDLSKIAWKQGTKSPQDTPSTQRPLPSPICSNTTSFSLNTTTTRRPNQATPPQGHSSSTGTNDVNIKMHFIVDPAPADAMHKQSTFTAPPSFLSMPVAAFPRPYPVYYGIPPMGYYPPYPYPPPMMPGSYFFTPRVYPPASARPQQSPKVKRVDAAVSVVMDDNNTSKKGCSTQVNSPVRDKLLEEVPKFTTFEDARKVPDAPPVLLTFDLSNPKTDKGEEKSSLADMFKMRKKKLVEKLEQGNAGAKKVHEAKPKTKEELLIQRKKMMQPKTKPIEGERKKSMSECCIVTLEKPQIKKREPSQDLLARLATGAKPKICKEEMHKLTNKNYELLPEVKMKKEMERKKQEWKDRMDRMRKLEKRRIKLVKPKKEDCSSIN